MSWVQSFHDEFLMHTLLIRKDRTDLEKDISFLTKALRIGDGSLVLDQCCGIGSIAIPLSKRGCQVVGVDITPLYIEKAKAKSSTCELYCEDARTFTYPNCDGIFNWWTGFGYFSTDDENKKLIEQAFSSLRSGGTYLLDVPNLSGILRNFRPTMHSTHQTEMGTITLKRTTIMDLYCSRMEKEWVYRKDGVICAQHHTSVRIYGSHEIVAMFQEVGFSDITLLGNREGSPLSLDHLRCICIGRKP